jgi:choline dehydrogenase
MGDQEAIKAKGYDYIIIGAGSAGCVLANRLSADPNCEVLLLEAGEWDKNFWLKLPVGYVKTIFDKRFSRQFKTEPEQGTAGRSLIWPRGRVIGGSSSINALLFIRGQAQDFNDWEGQGAKGWSYKKVLPYFTRMESYSGRASTGRGTMGELSVSDLRNKNPICKAWIEAAKQYGLPENDGFNGGSNYGVGPFQLNINNRWRESASVAFLHPIRSRKNLTVQTGVHVSKILIHKKRAIGLEYLGEGQTHTIFADQEVILSAGALQSPQILQLSGVGPKDLLKRYGIDVLLDAPGVGQNLQDHFMARTIVKLNKPYSLNDEVRNPFRLMSMGLEWLVKGSGPLTVGAGQVGGGACSEFAKESRADVQFTVMPFSADKAGDPLHRYSGFTAAVYQCRPESRGVLEIKSPDPYSDPRIVPNYLSEKIDQRTLVSGVKMLREIYQQPAFKSLFDKEMLPGPSATSDEDILNFARNSGGTVFHPSGTCRMGSDETSVVDPNLNVCGIRGLRIVDASVIPKIPSGNINAPVMMIAEKAADIILNKSAK